MFGSRTTWKRRLDRLRGRSITDDLRPYRAALESIVGRRDELAAFRDGELRSVSLDLRGAARDGATPAELLVPAFALACETSRRAVGLQPFDVQIVAAQAMQNGNVVEMQTGEGKTLAAVLTAYLRALSGSAVHVLTHNDYLARRDAAWMGPIYRRLGLEVGHVQEGMTAAERRSGYAAAVTYVTAKEAGFDLLRDARCDGNDAPVHRPLGFAIVDEADSLLIDEARVPLVLAGEHEGTAGNSTRMARIAASLQRGRDYVTDEYGRNVELTDRGLDHCQAELGCGDLVDQENLELLTELHCALHAAALLRRDVDYVVRAGRIELVDEFTGRIVEDRHWPDGLQSALEAKEGLARRPEGQILGTITLQHFLLLYPELCGMTGTAQSAADELEEFYGLEVVVTPTNRPAIRVDHPDVVFTHGDAKLAALVEEIRTVHATRRPILVGTVSVEESERLARELAEVGVDCAVLNAKRDELEAGIVAEAGALDALTISTNMAGRGTDIRLGGADEADRERVVALGGLYVLGTNRHESERIDRQLRGRAGRQGDPGSSRFFVSLEDDLVCRYGIRRLIPAALYPEPQQGPIELPLIRSELARAQRIVEGQNFEIRRALHRYSSLIEDQRELVGRRRGSLMQAGTALALVADHAPELHAALRRAFDEADADTVARQVALFQLDRCWSEHLAEVAELRDRIHLVRIGGKDPLTEFGLRVVESFRRLFESADLAAVETLRSLDLGDGEIDLESLDLRGPSSTWTYVVNDDPFRDQIGMQLMGPGNSGVAAGAAFLTPAGPLLIAWGLYNRYKRKRTERSNR